MFVDSHAHFSRLDGEDGAADLLARAVAAGLDWLVAVGGDAAMNACAVQAAAASPGRILAAVGYDRDNARDVAAGERSQADLLHDIEALFNEIPGLSVLGEIGLDFHYTPETAREQNDLLRGQLRLARDRQLPVIVHSREAEEETLSALDEHRRAWGGDAGAIGVLHCFTYGPDTARRVLDLGYHVSFSGIVSFKNAATVRDAVRVVPDDRLLIETDTPYLAPTPHRGKPNEPAYICHVAEAVAAVRGVAAEHVAELTAQNAERLFGRPG